MKIQRRRGSALITVFIVMIFLGVMSASMMNTVYGNARSGEQEYWAIRSRIASHSMLLTLGHKIADDLVQEVTPLGKLTQGTKWWGAFDDQGMKIEVKVHVENANAFNLACWAKPTQGPNPGEWKKLRVLHRIDANGTHIRRFVWSNLTRELWDDFLGGA